MTGAHNKKAMEIVRQWQLANDRSIINLKNAIATALREAEDEALERAAKASSRHAGISRSWILPLSNERTGSELYSALREGMEIGKAIRALKSKERFMGILKYRSAEDCPDLDQHTPQPEGYLQRADWAKRMLKTYKQSRCPTCGYWAIWKPKKPRT